MTKFLVLVKNGPVVLASFEALSWDCWTCTAQHAGLADWLGGYLSVRPLKEKA